MPTTITIPGPTSGSQGREVLTANRDYFVAPPPLGSDGNTGLSVGTPFATINKAIDVASGLDLAAQHTVTIKIADGTYAENLMLPEVFGNFTASVFEIVGSIQLIGNLSSPGNVLIGNHTGRTIDVRGNGWLISGFRIKAGDVSGISIDGPHVLHIGNYLQGLSVNASTNFIDATNGGAFTGMDMDMQLFGTAWRSIFNANGGIINAFILLTVNDSPTWSQFVYAGAGGYANIAVFSSGAATGKAYTVSLNGIIDPNSSFGMPFPGSLPGSVDTGGYYDYVGNIAADLNNISSTRGTILHRGVSAWTALAPSATPGFFLKSSGAGADVSWDAAPGATGGEANTGSNAGTGGVGVFYQKSGVSLQFKNINSTSGAITVTDDVANHEVDLTLDPTAATAALNVFTTSLKGLVPSTGGATTTYLQANGTWSVPSGGGAPLVHFHNGADITSGTVDAARMPAFTGDVTSALGTAVNVLANNAVTNLKLADMAAATVKGSVAGGDPADLTGTQVTSLLNTFTSSLKGLAPSPAGATTTFLRADGIWTSPAAGSGIVVATTSRTLTVAESGITFTNEGAPGNVVYTLPPAAAGLVYYFIPTSNTLTMRVTAGAGDNIVTYGLGSPVASMTTSPGAATAYSCATFTAINATNWVADIAHSGSWTTP